MSDNHYPLPTTPPLECVAEMFKMIRDKTVAENWKDFSRHAYAVAGYGLYLLIGNEPPVMGADADGPGKFGAAVAAELSATPPEAFAAIPWATLLPLILQIVSLFVKKQ